MHRREIKAASVSIDSSSFTGLLSGVSDSQSAFEIIDLGCSRKTWVEKSSTALLLLSEIGASNVVSSSNAITLTLPSVGSGDDGIVAILKNNDASNTLTVAGSDADTVENSSVLPGNSIYLVYRHSDTEWKII